MDGCATRRATTPSHSRVDWTSRADFPIAFRQFPSNRVVLAGGRHRRRADHVEAYPLENAERVLGQKLESRIPPVGLRFDFSSAAQARRSSGRRVPSICGVWAHSRSGYFTAAGRLWPTHRILHRARLGCDLERSALGRRLGLQKGPTAWLFMLIVTAAPAFWLFHPPFVMRVILPFMRAIHAL